MPRDEHQPPLEAEQATGKKSKPWFTRNRGGLGYHPTTWQGGLILAIGVAVIAVIVVLLKTGLL